MTYLLLFGAYFVCAAAAYARSVSDNLVSYINHIVDSKSIELSLVFILVVTNLLPTRLFLNLCL